MTPEDTTSCPPSFRLDGKVAIITGASAGLGAHFARLLAGAGADVVVGARRVAELETLRQLVAADGGRCVTAATDVRDPQQCEVLARTAVEAFGRIDILVNNAGTGYAARAERDSPEQAARLFEINLLGAYQMAMPTARAMIEAGNGGSIINISSVLALGAGDVPQAAYSASKAGLLGLTRDLARQWSGKHSIRVNALAPGFFETELTAPLLDRPAGRDAVLERTTLGRIGRLDELSGPLLLLASDAGSYITGSTLCVDGGWVMH